VQQTVDNRKARSEATRNALMRAAEKLIAEQGMENISIREIVSAAGQKNESALQYHFSNLSGLIDAIVAERAEQTHLKRAELIADLTAHSPEPALRELCMLMVQPAFDLARADVGFRRYVKAFGHQLMLTEDSPLAAISEHGIDGPSGKQMSRLLQAALPHLDAAAFKRRMEAVVRLCSASMYHQSRQRGAFKGPAADLFLHSLIDTLVGLLDAPLSPETKALAKQLRAS